MLDNYLKFSRLLKENIIEIRNKRLGKVIRTYNFYDACQIIDLNKNPTIYQNFRESKVAIINQCKEQNSNESFILCFKQTIIFFNQSTFTFLGNLFSSNSDLSFYLIQLTF